jgi:hypothetical protein
MSNKGILRQVREAGPATGDLIHDEMRDAIFNTELVGGGARHVMIGGLILGTDGSAFDVETGEPATIEQRIHADKLMKQFLNKP